MNPRSPDFVGRAVHLRGPGGRLIASLACGIALTVSAAAAPRLDKSVAFVKAEASRAVALLGSRAPGGAARNTLFRALILDAFDVKGVAQYVCGPYWDRATAAQKARFLPVFQNALVKTYTSRLADYSGEKVEVSDTRTQGDTVVVTTSLTGGSSQDVRALDWKILEVARKPKLFDIAIDGISTTETTREDYMSVLSQQGGNLDVLTDKLQAGQ